MSTSKPRIATLCHSKGLSKESLSSLLRRVAVSDTQESLIVDRSPMITDINGDEVDLDCSYDKHILESHARPTVDSIFKASVKIAKPFSYYIEMLNTCYPNARLPRGCRTISPAVSYRRMTDSEYSEHMKTLTRKFSFNPRAVLSKHTMK